jgi:hypothetical protein
MSRSAQRQYHGEWQGACPQTTVCIQSNSCDLSRHRHPLPIPKRFFTDISVNFITPLPKCTRFGCTYEHIMVTVDQLCKKQKFIPLENLETVTVVRAFVEYVWRKEGFPSTIVSTEEPSLFRTSGRSSARNLASHQSCQLHTTLRLNRTSPVADIHTITSTEMPPCTELEVSQRHPQSIRCQGPSAYSKSTHT